MTALEGQRGFAMQDDVAHLSNPLLVQRAPTIITAYVRSLKGQDENINSSYLLCLTRTYSRSYPISHTVTSSYITQVSSLETLFSRLETRLSHGIVGVLALGLIGTAAAGTSDIFGPTVLTVLLSVRSTGRTYFAQLQ